MTLTSRRCFRLAGVVGLATAIAYALALPSPFLAPLLAIVLCAEPSPPPAGKGLLVIVFALNIIMGIGLIMSPFLFIYPVTCVLLIALGVYFTTYMTVGKGKVAMGLLLTISITLIPAIGLMQYALAVTVVQSMVIGFVIAILCQWLIYPFFPEDSLPEKKQLDKQPDEVEAKWISIRSVVIIMPAVLLAFTNPSMYMATIIKTSVIARTATKLDAREAGVQLIVSTLLAGFLAMLFWFALKLWPNLWMFTLWMTLFALYFAAKMYGVIQTRYPASFWQDTALTLLILLGPAVQDTANGKDPYHAFLVRFSLFVAVTLYAWLSIVMLERWRQKKQSKKMAATLGVV